MARGVSRRQGGKASRNPPFYMDETKVTNLKYVEFLNLEIARIKVEGMDVKGDGQLWAILGPVYGSYEPIVFENGRFMLSNSAYSNYPVVRVTAWGARAYAKFYGEHLPSELEWFHAATVGSELSKSARNDQVDQRRSHLTLKTGC